MSFQYNPLTGRLDIVGAGGSSTTIWERVSDTVSSSSTETVDSVANASFQSLKYIVTAFNDANTTYGSFEFNVLNNNGSYLDTVSHRLRSGLNIAVNSVNNAGTFELQITNNESFDLNIELAKLVLS